MSQPSAKNLSEVPVRTILVLAANPTGTSHVRLDREVRDIHTELKQTQYRDRFRLEQRWAIRYRSVQGALQETRPQIVHFAGHGEGDDGLIFEDEIGNPRFVSANALANLFRLCAKHVECVVLNACFTEVQAKAIARHIPYVIGMRWAIGDIAAQEFAVGFYRALGRGYSTEESYEWGCNAIELANIPEDKTPILIQQPSASIILPEMVVPGKPLISQNSSEDHSFEQSNYQENQIVSSLSDEPHIQSSPQNLEQLSSGRPEGISNAPRRNFRFRKLITFGLIAFTAAILLIGFSYIFSPPSPVESWISFGEKSLLDSSLYQSFEKEQYDVVKRQGMQSFQNQDYVTAIRQFTNVRSAAADKVLDSNSSDSARAAALATLKDPEILIFRNNAEARQRQQDDPNKPLYTIAVVGPMKLDAGIHTLFGIAQAQDQAVKKNLNLQVLIADDGNDSAQAVKVAKELSVNNEIVAVVGHYASSITCSTLPFYSRRNLVVVSPGSSMFDLRERCGDSKDVFFRVASSTQVEADSLVTYLLSKNEANDLKVVVFYNEGEVFSKSMFEEFSDALSENEGEVIEAFDLSEEGFSLNQFSDAIKEASALAVFPDGQVAGGNNSFDRAISVIQQNNGEKLIVGSNTLYLMQSLNYLESSELTNLLVIAVDWHPDDPRAKTFADEAEEYWYGGVNYRTAMAFEATEVLAKILQTGENTRLGIKRELSVFNSESGVLSDTTISFDMNGDRQEADRILVTPVVNQDSREPKFCIVESPCTN